MLFNGFMRNFGLPKKNCIHSSHENYLCSVKDCRQRQRWCYNPNGQIFVILTGGISILKCFTTKIYANQLVLFPAVLCLRMLCLGLGVLAPSFEKLCVLTANLVMKFCHSCAPHGRWNLKSFVRLFGGRDRYFRYESRREIHTSDAYVQDDRCYYCPLCSPAFMSWLPPASPCGKHGNWRICSILND